MQIFLFIFILAFPVLGLCEPAKLIAQYEADLYPHTDPFRVVYNLEHGQLIFGKLKKYKPLSLISEALIAFHAHSQKKADDDLIHAVLEECEQVFNLDQTSKLQKQSNLLALYYLRDYLSRFEQKESIPDRNGKNFVQKEQEQKNGNKEKQNAEYPELPDAYQPQTDDTENQEAGSKNDQVIVLETNFPTPYFGQKTYAEVTRHVNPPLKSIALPMQLPAPEAYQNTDKEMLVYPLGKTELLLFLAPGYEPRQPEDPRAHITRDAHGVYRVKISEPLKVLRIPLQSARPHFLNPILQEIYTRPVGFDQAQWPALIRSDLLDKPLTGTLSIAQAVSNHLATKYLYSIKARPEKDPVDALNAGAFQCDMAAYLMVGILRDVYQIPSRIVLGYRGKKHGKGQNSRSYLVLPNDAHAWVEVYEKGIWHPFDPTPILKDGEEKDPAGEGDEYSDRTLEEQPTLPSEQEQYSNSHSQNESQNQTGLEMDSRDLADLLRLGSLQLEPSEDRDPLRERATRVLLRLILNPNFDALKTYKKLYEARTLFLSKRELKSLVQELLLVHEKKHPASKAWLEEIIVFLEQRDLATTYQNLYRLKQSLAGYSILLDKKSSILDQTLYCLDSVLRDIYQLADINSDEISMVSEFYHSLPSLVQTLLAQKYGLNQVGINQPTKEVARLLKNGSLNDLRLLALLSPVSEFILNSTPRPEFQQVRTWARDPRRPIGNDLLLLQRLSELPRSLITQPSKSLEQNILERTIFTPTFRQRVDIPTGFGKDDAERISIVLYDTSGSMSGDSARFQAGLISAFTARALSDLAPSGAHRHRVVLVPFDNQPGTPTKVTNTQEALEMIHHYHSKLANTGGGTDIQAALIQAMALIADAERRFGEPLAAANIILMTDGQSKLDIPQLAKARSAIDRTTPLQIMFIAINGVNQELRDFAEESKKAGIETGFYREFDSSEITKYLSKAETNHNTLSKDRIYTDKIPRDLSSNTRLILKQALVLLSKFSLQIEQNSQYTSPGEHLKTLETTIWSRPTSIKRPLQLWIQNLRTLAYNSALNKDFVLKAQLADDIWHHFEKITGVSLSELSQNELIELKHYLCHAAKLGALGCPN